jgi:HlyD family secretion protein
MPCQEDFHGICFARDRSNDQWSYCHEIRPCRFSSGRRRGFPLATSPINGDVLQSDVRLGQYAATGQLEKPLMMLGNVEPMNVRVDIDEQDAWRVREGAPATATVLGNSEQRVNLTFVRFEPYVLPKKWLTGNSTERTDTRVLQAIFRIQPSRLPLFVGQQLDVFTD